MRFVYVFVMIFLAVFGFAVLLKILFDALLDSSARRFDVSVTYSEDIEEFLDYARKSGHIGKVTVISDNASDLSAIKKKYDNVVCEKKR